MSGSPYIRKKAEVARSFDYKLAEVAAGNLDLGRARWHMDGLEQREQLEVHNFGVWGGRCWCWCRWGRIFRAVLRQSLLEHIEINGVRRNHQTYERVGYLGPIIQNLSSCCRCGFLQLKKEL